MALSKSHEAFSVDFIFNFLLYGVRVNNAATAGLEAFIKMMKAVLHYDTNLVFLCKYCVKATILFLLLAEIRFHSLTAILKCFAAGSEVSEILHCPH